MQKMSNNFLEARENVQFLAQIHHLSVFNDWALTRKFINKKEWSGIKKLLSSQSIKDIVVAKAVLEVKINIL
jgi:hypothetical protein